MPLQGTNAKAERDPRRGILLWALLVSLIAGMINLGMPIDSTLRILRNELRAREASGEIVFVGIDDKSLQGSYRWPWPRRHYARITDSLAAAGVTKVYFDLDLSVKSVPEEDRLFAEALERADGKVVLPARWAFNPRTGERTDHIPIDTFLPHVDVAHINVWYDAFGFAWALPLSHTISGQKYPSFASRLAGKPDLSGESFTLDYAIRIDSVPYISAADVLAGRTPREMLAGRIAVVAPASALLDDNQLIPGYGRMPGGFIHVIGAETLKRGIPVNLGWIPPSLVALAAAIGMLLARNGRIRIPLAVGGFAVLLVVPLALEEALIFVDVAPALLLLGIVAARLAISAVRNRGATHNLATGLPNLNALRIDPPVPGAELVVAKIRNFAEITSTLPDEMEQAVVDQVVARLGLAAAQGRVYQGDEGIFAWYLAGDGEVRLGDQIEALHALFRAPIRIGSRSVDASIAFGVDLSADRPTANRLGSALVAVDEAAAEGLRWKGYDPERLKSAEWNLSLLGRLDAAIDEGEVWVAFQPKLDLATGRVTGAEALARWTHPQKGEISPADFILVAEQHNRIERLTDFVLRSSLAAIRRISVQSPGFTIAVNLSPRLLDDASIVGQIDRALRDHGVAADSLTIEVTESAAIATSAQAIETLARLCALGVRLSIDDYGTGFSTLEYLKKVPAAEIKIDKSFVSQIAISAADRLMVNSTIELAHSLGRKVVAEGVEDQETLSILHRMGCDSVQGYCVSRPMPLESLLAFIAAGPRRIAA